MSSPRPRPALRLLTCVLLASWACTTESADRDTGGGEPAANLPPVAAAGGDRAVAESTPVALDGSGSSDPDGDIAHYSWSQIAGPAVALADADSDVATFTAPDVGADTDLTFRLTVTDDGGDTDSDDVTITVVDSPPPGLDARPSNPTCVAPARPIPSAAISLTRVYPGVAGLLRPVVFLQAPEDASRWFVVEQRGVVKVFDADPAASTSAVFADIEARVDDGPSEAGLLGMAFHPDFDLATNREVFLSYTAPGLESRVSRFTANADGQTLDTSSEEILLRVDQDFTNHNGGNIAFGPDGFLYLGLGDGGSGNDPNNRAQDNRYLLGTLLRIDVDGGTPYAIPSDNPFAGSALCDADGISPRGDPCPEIYAFGLRNPWRWSFDRDNGALWLGDVGQNTWEEVDVVERGGNYGWKIREGAHCRPPTTGCQTAGLIDPVAEYGHDLGIAITGGYVYRGRSIPELYGRYLFADYGSGRIWTLLPNEDGELERVELLDTDHNISSFGEGVDGELYVLALSGEIDRIDAGGAGSGAAIPTRLSDTGCVNPTDPTQPDAGLIPYDIQAPFWSDGAEKERWMALPDGTNVAVQPEGDFDFPPGSVLMKSFRLDGDLVETRLLMRHPDGVWAGYSYAWDTAQTDATLVRGGKVVTIGTQDYIYPSGGDCLRCHTSAAGRSLGLEIAQLNRDLTYPSTGRTANQLATLEAIGIFGAPLPDLPANLPVLTEPSDTSASDEDRARAYLHTNCAQCHRPLGPTPVDMDLRHATPLAQAKVCGVTPAEGDLGIGGAQRLLPGDPARSMLLERMRRRDAHGMPPLGSALPDDAGAALLDVWILGLTGCP
jgi:uncharacterized repeat protein (TIGR03806 family)